MKTDAFTVAQVVTMLQVPQEVVWGLVYSIPGIRVGRLGEEPKLARHVLFRWLSNAYRTVTSEMGDSCDIG